MTPAAADSLGPLPLSSDIENLQSRGSKEISRMKKLQEKKKILNGPEEDDYSPSHPDSSSQTSSLDGVSLTNSSSSKAHPFKVVEQDSLSLTGTRTRPDIVNCSEPPVPPPRRKKRNKSPTISIYSNVLDHRGIGGSGSGTAGAAAQPITAQDEEKNKSKKLWA
jgi:hypothetical protein